MRRTAVPGFTGIGIFRKWHSRSASGGSVCSISRCTTRSISRSTACICSIRRGISNCIVCDADICEQFFRQVILPDDVCRTGFRGSGYGRSDIDGSGISAGSGIHDRSGISADSGIYNRSGISVYSAIPAGNICTIRIRFIGISTVRFIAGTFFSAFRPALSGFPDFNRDISRRGAVALSSTVRAAARSLFHSTLQLFCRNCHADSHTRGSQDQQT